MTREEAINKLEYLINSPVGREEIDETCYEVMDYLSAQEPRVMTIEELRGYSGPVWVEWRDERYAYENGWKVATFTEEYAADDETYNGKDYRYWTSCPTDEQRRAVKWDG